MTTRRDWTTDVGLLVVGLAAALLTFTTLRDLALACGITGDFLWIKLAYLVPITVDAAGVVAARVWLKREAGPDAVAFARALAWACIGSSVLGNAGQHGMAAFDLLPPWWVVVLVSAVPPAALGAVVHLGHLTRRTDGPAGQTTGQTGAPGAPADAPTTTVASAVVPAAVPAGPAPDQGGHAERPATGPADGPGQARGPIGPDAPDDLILQWLREQAEETGTVPARKATRDRWAIGSTRADRLRDQVVPAGKPGLRRVQ